MNLCLFLFIYFLGLTGVICKPKCEDFTTCGSCVFSTGDDCQWCPNEEHKGKRCQSSKEISKGWCEATISKPEIYLNITKDFDWCSGEKCGDIVQLKPQKAIIKSASPGVPVNITMYYKPAKDAPLDIYFLIDNSGNIKKYTDILTNQTSSIFKEIKNYTNNVRLGLGTFIEKPALPFANPDFRNTYMFRNELSLTNNSEKFITSLKQITPGGNYDSPEDILDALMQTMLCRTKISWRTDGHRFIVVYTNAFYHAAGDGKMIGAFKRHDMKCQENSDMNIVMDYPSIAQVNKVAKDNGFTIFFVYITGKNDRITKEHFKLLSQKIYGSKYVEMNKGKISKMIKDEYAKLIEDVDIRYESSPNVQVKVKKACPSCKAMHSTPIQFEVTVNVVSCLSAQKNKEIVKFTPKQLNENLQVDIEVVCECDCEKDKLKQINSGKCNSRGDYQCGICICRPDRSGDHCECEIDSVNFNVDYKKCKKNANDAMLCSGHGECSCGKCGPCHTGFSGPYCEYDENACPRPGGNLCSGHGNCSMGACQCNPNWKHSLNGIDDCGCTLETKSCIAPHSSKVCSGNGECICGRCTCNNMENSNDTCSGLFCDKCPWFIAKRCEELEDYAYCRFLKKNSCQEIYNLTDTSVDFASRSEINSPNNTEWYMANLCRVKKGNDDSIFVFKYYYSSSDTSTEAESNNTMLHLVIQTELDEKPPADIWVPVGIAIGTILLIGLFTLILWKVLTDMYDAREYNQFVEKAKAAGYDVSMTENPWYEPPTTTFLNPAHNFASCN